jgi:hypothetical protein
VRRLVWFVFLPAAVRAQAGDGQPFSLGAARFLFGAWDGSRISVLGMGLSSKGRILTHKLDGTLDLSRVHGAGQGPYQT